MLLSRCSRRWETPIYYPNTDFHLPGGKSLKGLAPAVIGAPVLTCSQYPSKPCCPIGILTVGAVLSWDLTLLDRNLDCSVTSFVNHMGKLQNACEAVGVHAIDSFADRRYLHSRTGHLRKPPPYAPWLTSWAIDC
jgi:hypothetical protein